MSDVRKQEEVSVSDVVVDVEAVTASVPSDMKLYTMDIESTNDLRSPFFNVGFQMISYGIQLFQLALLCVMIDRNGSFTLQNATTEIIFGQVFVFWYLTFNCPSQLSNYTRLRMSLYHKDTSPPYLDMIKNRDGQGLVAAFLINCQFGCKMVWNLVKSGMVVFCYNFTELSSEPERKMIGFPETFLAKWVRAGGYFLEQVNITLLMMGAVTITNNQANLVDVIFNFGAILIIADLDEILMKTFPFKTMKVLVPVDFEPNELRFDRTSCEMGEFAYCGTFLTFLMLAGR